jgi:hypothetical protein
MTPWYRRFPQRLEAELSLLRATSKAVVRLDGETLVADEEIVIGRYRFGYRIVFPPDFPYSPPAFRLGYPKLPHIQDLHIFSDGSLCLLGVDEWAPTLTAAALRARAVLWCNCIVAYLSSGTFIQPTRPKTRS